MSRVAPRPLTRKVRFRSFFHPARARLWRLNSYFCLLPRGARQAAAHGHLSRISRWTAQRVSIFLLGDNSKLPGRHNRSGADCENLGAYFTRNPASPSYLFPFSGQFLSRTSRCPGLLRRCSRASARGQFRPTRYRIGSGIHPW